MSGRSVVPRFATIDTIVLKVRRFRASVRRPEGADFFMEKIRKNINEPHEQRLVGVCASVASIEQLTGQPVHETAKQLASWMAMSESMIPKTSGQIQSLIEDGKYIVLIAEGSVVAGCGTTFVFEGPAENGEMKKVPEVGGLVVNPNERKKGFGTDAAVAYVLYAQEQDPDTQYIVFVNGQSAGIFTGELHATPMTQEQIIADMPRPIYTEGCATCPKKPAKWDATAPISELAAGCCDTPCAIPRRRGQ